MKIADKIMVRKRELLFALSFLLTIVIVSSFVSATTQTFYGTSEDGYVAEQDGLFEYIQNGANYISAVEARPGSGAAFSYGGFLGFDTSELPDNAVITSATLSLYGKTFSNPENSESPVAYLSEYTNLVLVPGNFNVYSFPWGQTLEMSDYHDFMTSWYPDTTPLPTGLVSQKASSAWQTNSYNSLTITDLSSINLVGKTDFIAWPAMTNTLSGKLIRMDFYSQESSDINKRPKLVVEYDVASPACTTGMFEYTLTGLDKWLQNTEVNCQSDPAAHPAGSGWEFVKRECFASPLKNGVQTCMSDSCLWRKAASQKYEYVTTGAGSGGDPVDCETGQGGANGASDPVPTGYTLKSKICVVPLTNGCNVNICLWQKATTSEYQYLTTHAGSGGTVVNCADPNMQPATGNGWTNDPPPAGYNLVHRNCVYSPAVNGVTTCISDFCFWQNTCPAPPQTDPNRCSSASQIIFRMSAETDAHAEVYSPTGIYPKEICYDKFFGTQGSGNRACLSNGANKVLGLSANTNAHVEGPTGTAYTNANVCYDNLNCATRNSCQANEKAIASLSADTNAHVANATGVGSYPLKLCCKVGGSQPPTSYTISDAYWRSYRNGPLPIAYRGNVVKMVAETNAPDGTEASYEVRKVRAGSDLNLELGEIKANVANGKVTAELDLTAQLLAGNASLAEGARDDFYFKVFIGSVNKESNRTVFVNDFGPDANPVANITAPKHRGIYFTGVELNFTQDSYDFEGPIRQIRWQINDATFDASTDVNKTNFTYTYTTPGVKLINLTVWDSARNSDIDEVEILVLDSTAIGMQRALAYIESPHINQIISSDAITPVVPYKGEDSYVVNASIVNIFGGCATTVECLAGNCPVETEHSPSCAADKNAKLPVATPQKGFNELIFNWTFDDGSSVKGTGVYSGGAHNYARPAGNNNKVIKLFLEYAPSAGEYSGANFTRNFKLLAFGCTADGTKYIEQGSNGQVIEHPTETEIDACRGADIFGTQDDCCPTGKTCRADNGQTLCRPSPPGPGDCSSPVVENQCNPSRSQVLREIEGVGCGNRRLNDNKLVNCFQCAWDSGTSNQLCWVNYTLVGSPGCVGSNCVPPTNDGPICEVSYTETKLDGGYCRYDFTVTKTSGTGTCEQIPSKTYPCSSELIELSFFGAMQFIVAGLLIALVYYGIIRLSRNKKDKLKAVGMRRN